MKEGREEREEREEKKKGEKSRGGEQRRERKKEKIEDRVARSGEPDSMPRLATEGRKGREARRKVEGEASQAQGKGRNHLKENTYMTERSQVKGRAIRGEAMLRTGQYAQAGSRPLMEIG